MNSNSLNIRSYLKKVGTRYTLPIYVSPKSARTAIKGERMGRVWISITSIPEAGKANEELCSFIANKLGLSKSAVKVISGHKSRTKIVAINSGGNF